MNFSSKIIFEANYLIMPRISPQSILFLCALLVSSFSFSQTGPGGVDTNLHLWFKANQGAQSDGSGTAAVNSDPVQIWQDQSGNDFDADQTTTSGSRPIYNSNVINGNPALVFDGNDDYFPITTLNYAASGGLSGITFYAILSTTNTGEGVILSYDRNEYFRFASDHDNDGGFGLSTTNSAAATDDFNATSAIEIDGIPHILGASASTSVGINKFLYFDGTVNNSTDVGTTAFGTGTTRFGFLGVGSEADVFDGTQGPTNYLEGDFAEFLYYQTELTNVQRQRVESYLAIKYGITLSTDSDGDATALETVDGIDEGDYVTSGGTAVWDASANSAYHFNLAGVGRDDNSQLLQTSSQSINSGSIMFLTETTLIDEDFVIWGNNNAALTSSASGSGFQRELNRVWKIQSNSTDVSDIDQITFDLSTISVLPEDVSDFVLLIDTDEDFSDATTVPADDFTGGVLTFDNVDLSGATFFTIGYNLSSPGGIGANLAFWFRADAGTEEAAFDDAEDGDQVRFWRDQSGNGYDGNQTTIADRPRYDATNTINFNPILTFDGGSNFSISNLNYDITTNTLDEFSIFSVVKSTQADEGIIVSYDRSSFYRFAINHNDNPNFGLSTTVEGATDETDDNNASNSGSDGFTHLIGGDYTTSTDEKNLYFDGSVENIAGSHGATGGILGLSTEVPRYGFIASNSEANDPTDGGNGGGINGDIAEIIYFEGLLGATERGRIQSYLAVKYGITLSSDYLASDGSTQWAMDASYPNRIAGVALDAGANLNQTQSKSEADDAILTISEANLADGDYIIWASDSDPVVLTGSPLAGFDDQIDRTWKFAVNGSAAASSVDQLTFDLSDIIIKPSDFNVYRLVGDDNPSFSSPSELATPISLIDDELIFTGVNLSTETYYTIVLDPDLDGDGVADADDLDDDNDGIPDVNEGSGVVDTDGDGIFDSRDLDSDNDGIGDLYESGAETETDGITLATLDSDGDGVIDTGNEGANGFDDRLEVGNVDGGGIDYTISNYETTIDAGGIAGPEDFRDLDTDNNGISDLVESGRSTNVDSDDDGIFEGTDTDQDGVPDEIDAEINSFGSTLLIPINQDGTGEPDFRDIDNDEDGTNDIDEVGLTDVDMDGMLDSSTDADNDGVLSERDDDDAVFAQINNADLLSGAGTDWYSYKTGDWTDPNNWTTDPSGTTRINPGSLIPNNFVDNVTILNGDEMTLNFDGLVISSMTVEEGGTLNIGTTINHNFNVISGQGSISLASDEFPGGTTTNFVSGSGGTVIYTDQDPAADYELTVDRTFNNIIFSSVANTITLKADLTLNGDLTVQSGTLQINDNTADSYSDNTTPIDILINGDLIVDASGAITVGDVDASSEIASSGIFTFHEIELLGDMTNNGLISLTNLSNTSITDGRYRDKYPTAADTDNNTGSNDIPTSEFGAVEVLFTNGLADQLITLNGPTDFYRIEVAKGTSQTFIAEFNASATANFRLLGRIAMDMSDDSGDTPNIDNNRALGLEAGILKLGTNIVIDQIAKEDTNGSDASTQGGNRNYIIDLDAQLWLAENSQVTKENDWGIHPFGKLKVSDDALLTFTGTGQRGILVDNQGIFEMTGGTVDITQFRNKTGSDGAPRGSFIMTGGTLNVGNGGADGSHAIFSVPWEEQNFVLSASDEANPPTINITLDGNRGKDNAAIQIGAAEGNYDIGVSNINVIHTSNTDYKIVSTAPLYNLTYSNSGTGELIIDNIVDANDDPPGGGGVLPDDNSGTTPSPAQFAFPLTITNDFTLTDGRFDANDFDITIGNLFTITSGAQYDPGNNTTYFNGSSPIQRIRLNGITPVGTALTPGFNNLSFSGSGTTKEFGGDLASFTVLGDLSVGSGVTLDDGGKSIIVNGNISNSGIHETDFNAAGRIELSGGASQHTIGGDGNGRFEILTLDDALGATFTASQQVDSVFNLVNGILDINTNQLTINSTAVNPIIDDDADDDLNGDDTDGSATNNFDATRMIQTAGNASDGGLNYYMNSDETLILPLGTSGKYTPSTIDIALTAGETGYVSTTPVDQALATTASATDLLDFYWRVGYSDFTSLPTINSYLFIYDESDVVGTESNYLPGFVEDNEDADLDGNSFTRNTDGTTADVDDATTNTITFDGGGSGFILQAANYTAGESAAFTGTVEVYYSRLTNGFVGSPGAADDWDNPNTWSTDPINQHDGVAASDYPQAGDVAIIRSFATSGERKVIIGIENYSGDAGIDVQVAQLILERENVNDPGNDDNNRLMIAQNANVDFGIVDGDAFIQVFVNPSSTTVFNDTDFGAFVDRADEGAQFLFYGTADGTSSLPSEITEYPNVRFEGNNNTAIDRFFQFPSDATVYGLIVDNGATFLMNRNITVTDEFRTGAFNEGFLQFDGTNGAVTLDVGADFVMRNDPDNRVFVNNSAANLEHRIIVRGELNFNANGVTEFDLFTDNTTGDNVILQFSPEEGLATQWINDDGILPELYRLVMDGGSSVSTSTTITTDFDLNGPTDGTDKALEIVNGDLILNNAGIDIDLNGGGGNFTIPATAGLTVQSGTVRTTATGVGSGNGIRLNGKLTVSGGDVILDGGTTADNFIEYGTGGAAEIEITSGNLIVGSQLRRNVLSGDGVINYTQTGGTAIFGANDGPEDSRGVFEIVNTGSPGTSSFTLSGASTVFAIVHAQASPTNGTFIIGDDVSVNVASDAIIDFGYSDTPIATVYANDLNETYEITSSAALPNVRINNANNNSPVVEMIIQPLTVTDNLQILNGASFIANGFDLTVNDGFTNDGSYTPGNNTTTFNGDVQVIDGSSSTVFNHLVSNPNTSLSLANTITVNGDLGVISGTFNDDGNRVTLLGDLNATTDLVSDGSGTGGIDMNGTSIQNLSLPDGAATIDKLLINNPNGVNQLENGGVATTLTINDELALDNGLYNLNDNRLIFDPDADATSSTGFDETKMISVNGVKKSDGVERQFLSVNGDVAAFELPIGTPDKYTPVTLDVDGSGEDGSLLVKPINSIHPSATGPDALNYYWLVTTDPSTVTGFSGSVSFQYLEEDANNAGQNESTWENNAARLLAPNWFKPSGNLVDITGNLMTFTNADLSSFGGTTFDGEFTIGNDIPDELAQYRSNADGIWNTPGIWDVENDGDGMFDDGNGVPQPGTVVIVDDIVTMSSSTDNDQNVFSLQIDGTLDIADSDGHNFGDISGTGTLRISNSTLPGGNYDNFFLTTGGALDLSGPSGYTISPDFASGIRGLTVSGGGTKVLPAITINVGADGINVLENATLTNSNNRVLTTSGDATINTTGSLNLGTSAASLVADNFNLISGTFNTTGAAIDLSGDLSLQGGTFNSGGATHTLEGDLAYNTAATFNRGTGRITFNGTGAQSITTNAATTLNFHNLRVNKSSGTMTLGADITALVNNRLGLINGSIINTQSSGSQLRLVGLATYSVSPVTTGFVNGPLFKDLDDESSAFTFRIGKGTTYKPVVIDPLNGSYVGDITWEAEYYAASAATFSSGENTILDLTTIEDNADDDEQVVQILAAEYWRLDDGGGSASLEEITLDISNIGISQDDINDQLLQVMFWDETNSEWDHLGGSSSGVPSSANVVSQANLSFSEKIVTTGAESSTVLPVELISFSGEIVDNKTKLTWETATEINNDYFEVQHSLDGVTFETVGQVDGSGDSNEVIAYSFTHNSPSFGANYYRLKQVDFDGKSEIHETLLLTNDFVRRGIEAIIYPNPGSAANLRLKLSSGDDHTNVEVRIVDVSGKVYFKKSFNGDLNVDEKLQVGDKMVKGVYFVEIIQGENVKRQKLIIK